MSLSAAESRLNATAQGSSFHAAMLLLPKRKRKALLTLYALCRTLDDVVDDAPDAATAQTDLAAWRAELDNVFTDGLPLTELAQDFQHAHTHYVFNAADMDAMLDALTMDAEDRMRRPTHAELDRYCYGVASAVGLMSMRIFGCEGEDANAFAIALGHALQRTNILRDVQVDAAIGRVYLPAEWTDEQDTPALLATDPSSTQQACRRLADEAAEYFRIADNHGQHLPARAIAPALAMRDVYAAYWRALNARNWQPPADGNIKLGAAQKASLAQRAGGYMLGQFRPVDLG